MMSNDIDPYCERLLEILQDGNVEQCALEACKKFEDIRTKWISVKGEHNKYGIKDSAEYRVFLMKEIYGALEEHNAEKAYTGDVLNIKRDKHNTLYGFIQHAPNNVFSTNLIIPI